MAEDTHNVAALVLYTSDNQFVMQRRDNKAPTFPNMLALFGGHIQMSEKPAEAAVREYHEELSVHLPDLEVVGVLSRYRHPDLDNVLMDINIFAALLNEKHFEVYEGKGAEWIPFQDVHFRSDIISDSKDALELFLKERQNVRI
ncbi:MAG TPA: NUDIX domain-containing protein [Candidatus Saccharimonadales bacterium]|nr:NUDIX domain-containing protein [Candidatus Saccharimonadales bacterium]